MSNNYLHLDGLYAFADRIGDYGYNYLPGGEKPERQRYLLARIASIAQAVLILINTTVKQSLRCGIFILSGILTFNWMRIKIGTKDGVSVLVQLIALPILGLMAFISPDFSTTQAYEIARKLNPNWIMYQHKDVEHNGDGVSFIQHQHVQVFDIESIKFFQWCILPIQAATYSIATCFQELLCLKPRQALKQLGYFFLSPFSLFACLPNSYVEIIQGYIPADKRAS